MTEPNRNKVFIEKAVNLSKGGDLRELFIDGFKPPRIAQLEKEIEMMNEHNVDNNLGRGLMEAELKGIKWATEKIINLIVKFFGKHLTYDVVSLNDDEIRELMKEIKKIGRLE